MTKLDVWSNNYFDFAVMPREEEHKESGRWQIGTAGLTDGLRIAGALFLGNWNVPKICFSRPYQNIPIKMSLYQHNHIKMSGTVAWEQRKASVIIVGIKVYG